MKQGVKESIRVRIVGLPAIPVEKCFPGILCRSFQSLQHGGEIDRLDPDRYSDHLEIRLHLLSDLKVFLVVIDPEIELIQPGAFGITRLGQIASRQGRVVGIAGPSRVIAGDAGGENPAGRSVSALLELKADRFPIHCVIDCFAEVRVSSERLPGQIHTVVVGGEVGPLPIIVGQIAG